MVNLKTLETKKPDYFNPVKLNTQRDYFCDNYQLIFSPSISRWNIMLNGNQIIDDSHPDFLEFVKCFDWQTFKTFDESVENDFIEFKEFKAYELSAQLEADGIPSWKSEELFQAFEECGYYTGFHD